MTRLLPAGSKSFLADRILLYEICEVCRVFPGAGTPTQYVGLTEHFSDWVCAEIDKGLAQYVRWYDARFEAQEKQGKYKIRQKYKTLGAVLGIDEEARRGGMEASELTDRSKSYLDAVIAARAARKAPPSITEWMESQKSQS
jgi:hypothetical protein